MAKIIAYQPGCYGNWVHWVLTYLSDLKDGLADKPNLPFSLNGDAHEWSSGNNSHLWPADNDHSTYFTSVVKDDNIYRIHPFVKNSKSVIDNIKWIINTLGKTVYLHTDIESIIWILNARTDKIYDAKNGPLKYYFSKKFLNDGIGSEDFEFIYKNHRETLEQWPKEFDDQGILERWIIREYLSVVMYDAVYENLTIDQNEEIMKLDLLAINVVDLRDNFSETIRKIAKYLDIDANLDEKVLSNLYNEWQATQIHFFKDKLLHDIIEATVNDLPMSWSNLTLVDEAVIQYLLRKRKFEIKCYGLNKFPSNTKQLRELIYAT